MHGTNARTEIVRKIDDLTSEQVRAWLVERQQKARTIRWKADTKRTSSEERFRPWADQARWVGA